MITRLGEVLYWCGSGIAAILFVLSFYALTGAERGFYALTGVEGGGSGERFAFAIWLVGAAVAIWAIGRACLYILAKR
jgi:hypothetical protein